MRQLHIHLSEQEKHIPVLVGHGLAEQLAAFLQNTFPDFGVFLLTDENIAPRHGERWQQVLAASTRFRDMLVVPAGEEEKSFARYCQLVDALLEQRAGRDTVLVIMGGGVLGDLGGFVAATLNRGIPYLQVPTTLLAQVDSSLGGKVGINHPLGKNLIGAFYQPAAVFADVAFLATLPEEEFYSGLGEVLKYALTLDKGLLDFMANGASQLLAGQPEVMVELISRCAKCKIQVVEQDEREKGWRAVLNFGHTVGHALEHLSGYRLKHGLAVIAGMQVALCLSEARLGCPAHLRSRLDHLIQLFQIPVPSLKQYPAEQVWQSLQRDKKSRQHSPRFVLLNAEGIPQLPVNISREEFLHAYRQAEALC